MAGYVIEDGPTPLEAFTSELASGLEAALGQKTLGNCRTVHLEPIAEFGAQHQKSGMPIAWIDTAGTIMLAAHEQVIPPEELYRLAREARRRLKATMPIVRVVAHPFTGQPGQFAITERRRDFAVEAPGLTLLDHLSQASQLVFGVGKVGDLFSGRGVTRSVPLFQAHAVMDEVISMFSKAPRGLIYANLPIMSPDLQDTLSTLQHVDRRLRDLQECLKVGDVLIITGDHGFDCARPNPGHSREYVPCLVTGPRLARGVNLGTRTTAADLAQTIGEALGAMIGATALGCLAVPLSAFRPKVAGPLCYVNLDTFLATVPRSAPPGKLHIRCNLELHHGGSLGHDTPATTCRLAVEDTHAEYGTSITAADGGIVRGRSRGPKRQSTCGQR
ncbi:MAG: hypothetical protein KF711_07685 [Nitrospira sp.]|nr:hypothetical protein [Nitrospira sp.]